MAIGLKMKALSRTLLIASLLAPALLSGAPASSSEHQKIKRECAKIGRTMVITRNGSPACGPAKATITTGPKLKKAKQARGGPTGIRFYYAAYGK